MASIVGYGNHGKDIEVIYQRCGRRPWLHPYDDDPETGHPSPDDGINGHLVIGVNDPIARRLIARRFAGVKALRPLIDPSAVIGPEVTIGRGSVIGPLSTLGSFVSLAHHVHINSSVSIVRTNVGPYSTVSPGAVICGNVEIGEACTIGANSTICERVTIGNEVVIGAGAIVTPYSVIPDGEVVKGVWGHSGPR